MTIEQRIYQGDRAREVLENEAFQGAFADIESEILEQWKNSPARDAEGRERLWTFLMLLRKVKATLHTTLDSGKLAMVQLQHDQKIAELRVPEWRAA
jgi:hypothetical protein